MPKKTSSKKPISVDLQKVEKIASGEPFVMLSLSLLRSKAWQEMSINCRRFIDFLMVEHMQHGGAENGRLVAPYDQLEQSGLSRRLISSAINEAEERGLVRVRRGGMKPFVKRAPSRYRLTFLPSKEVNEQGQPYFAKCTDEWKRHGEFVPKKLERKNGFQVPEGELNKGHKVNSGDNDDGPTAIRPRRKSMT